MWHEGGAAFVEPKAQDDALLKSPLADLCRRRDGPQFFGYLSRQLDDEMKERCFKYLLQAAVLDGTAEMVKVYTIVVIMNFPGGTNLLVGYR